MIPSPVPHQPTPPVSHGADYAAQGRRSGFTLIEVLVVITIIALVSGMVIAVYMDSLTEARVESTRATIRLLDSHLQDRMEAFQRLDFRSQGQRFQVWYSNAMPPNTPPAIAPKAAEMMVYKDRFRSAFPQRLEDLYGFDGIPGNADDAPLLRVWRQTNTENTNGRPMTHTIETESSELLYLFLTEGGSFGLPSLGLDELNPNHLKDGDGDGLMEIVDDWGNPIRFYSCPTRLVRPGGDSTPPVSNIDIEFYNATAGLVLASVSEPVAVPSVSPSTQMPFWFYRHPLNQDPQDPTAVLSLARDGEDLDRNGSLSADPPPPYAANGEDLNNDMMLSGGGAFVGMFDLRVSGSLTISARPLDETHYHTLNTYHQPLIVSAGPDGNLGLHEPTGDPTDPFNMTTAPRRLAQPLATGVTGSANAELIDDLYDNVTNRRR